MRAKTADEHELDDLESELDEEYEQVADDQLLVSAFEAHYAEHPEAYDPVED